VFHLPTPVYESAKVGKLLTLANFLDSGEFSASTRKVIASFSEANLLNFGFIIDNYRTMMLKIELLSRF
jgi:hypothetical protein